MKIKINNMNKTLACDYLDKCLSEYSIFGESNEEVVIETDEFGIERLVSDLKMNIEYVEE